MKIVHARMDRNHMATTFSFLVSCAENDARRASRALADAHEAVAALERALSEFAPESPVHRLNRALPGERVPLGADALGLLERSERFRELTLGAFDCTAKSSRAADPGAPRVAWDSSTGEAWRLDEGARLGFGAIGKGLALDRARAILERQGFGDFLLSGGGSSIVMSGFAGPGDPWTWGWSWKKDSSGAPLGAPLSHPTGRAIALGISGTHEKGEHLIDARGPGHARGPAALSALVAAPSAADADALSTALFVAGFEQSARQWRPLPFPVAMAEIGPGETPSWNGIFQQAFGPLSTASPRAPASSVAAAAASAMIALAALGAPASAAASTAIPAAGLATPLSGASAVADPVPAVPAPAGASAPAPTAADAPAGSPPATGADALEDGAIDLGGDALGGNQFAPYVTERNPWWSLLPLFALAVTLNHLRKVRRPPVKNSQLSMLVATTLAWTTLEQAHAVDLVPMGKALIGVLGTPKASKKTVGDSTVFYSKDAKGKADKVAFVEKNTWQKTCTHTWIVGIGKDGKVEQVVAQEQQCPHAKPAAAASFLDQYKGKGPADVAKLKDNVTTIAKATGSCELATDAVVHAITSYQKIKGQL